MNRQQFKLFIANAFKIKLPIALYARENLNLSLRRMKIYRKCDRVLS